MTPDENWLLRLPFTKDAIGVPAEPLIPDTDYLWAISSALPGYARISFTYDQTRSQSTAYIEMTPGMNSIVVNTSKLIDATPDFDVAKTELVYIGGFQDFDHTTLLRDGRHCLVPFRDRPPRHHPLKGLLPGLHGRELV